MLTAHSHCLDTVYNASSKVGGAGETRSTVGAELVPGRGAQLEMGFHSCEAERRRCLWAQRKMGESLGASSESRKRLPLTLAVGRVHREEKNSGPEAWEGMCSGDMQHTCQAPFGDHLS